VFAAVTEETGVLLGAQRTTLLRVESPEWARVVAAWSDGTAPPVPVGHRGALDGRGILGQMLRTARPVRIEDFDEVGGAVAALMRELGIRSGAGGPIILGGRVWGALSAVWPDGGLMPAGAEDRVAAFAELVSYAIENAETREELAASRARLVEAADAARRRIERDLHDGAQQRLVAAALELTILDQRLQRDPAGARVVLARAREQLECGLGELRDLARGIHPAVLTDRGLEAALDALVQRAPVPVDLHTAAPERLDAAIEAAAYFLVSEALTNVAKYAQADHRHRGCRVRRWRAGRDNRRRRRGRRRSRAGLRSSRPGRPGPRGRRPARSQKPTRTGHAAPRSTADERPRLTERPLAAQSRARAAAIPRALAPGAGGLRGRAA
jgi:signal transduction histidine kinase